MGEGGPQTTNSAANEANNIIAQAIQGQNSLIEAAIIADFPVLANPVWKFLLEEAIKFLSKYENIFFAQLVTGWIIDIQVNGEKAAAYQAAQALLNVINSKGDPDAIKKASDAMDAAYKSLVNWDGSATDMPK